MLMSPNNNSVLPIIDTHTHFDDAVFDADREHLAQQARVAGVKHLVLVGYLARYFERMSQVRNSLLGLEGETMPQIHLASGLHPAYIEQHKLEDLQLLQSFISEYEHVALGEIGMDTYTEALKAPESISKQTKFFNIQLDMAVDCELPVMLHIRKAHAESLKILKAHRYDAKKLGGIAHSFSGGEQEAKAFVKLGFKLGVTGQITNPNAKKLRRAITAAVQEFGLSCLVIETDCPDMTPVQCQIHDDSKDKQSHNRNVPSNLTYVLHTLSELFDTPKQTLAKQLWQNSCDALLMDWQYPLSCEYSF